MKLKKIAKFSILRFVYYNFLCSRIKRDKGCYILPYKGTVIDMAKGAEIELHGNLNLSYNRPSGSRAESFVILRENAKLTIEGNTVLAYGATLELHENAEIVIGSAYINVGAVILSAEKITIGNEVLISRGVYIYDSDHHPIVDEDGNQLNPPKPVSIEDHVWIGLRCLVLRGSRIGEGAMIATNSVVGGKIKAGTMASGNPARSYSEIRWKNSL